jgi:hypothetical protein
MGDCSSVCPSPLPELDSIEIRGEISYVNGNMLCVCSTQSSTGYFQQYSSDLYIKAHT